MGACLFDGDGFGEVAGLVDVAVFVDGDVVGEELEGDGGEDGGEGFGDAGDGDDVVGDGVDGGVAFGDDGDDFALAGFDFLDVGDGFFVDAVGGGDGDDGHFGVDEGDGTVFHFGGGVAFGVDVGDFFEFEGAFEGGGVVVAAPEVDEVAGVGEGFGKVGNGGGLLQDLGDVVGDVLEFAHEGGEAFVGDGAFFMGEGEGEHGEDGDLPCEGFGGGDAYFGTDVDVGTGVGCPCDGGADDVADAVDEGAA